MRKYGKWLLALGVLAACPAGVSAEGFPVGRMRSSQSATGGAAQQSRSQIAADQVAGALRNARIDGYDIDVEVRNGTAVINGKVRNAEDRTLATQVARSVPGVRQVENRLQHVPSGGVQQVSGQRQTESSAVRHAVTYETADSQRGMIQQVNSESYGGPGNQQTADQVAAALSQAGLVGYDVEIRVNNGVAFLSGSVGTPQQRQSASDVVSRVPGIRSVSNQLTVESGVAQTNYAPAPMPLQNTPMPQESMAAPLQIPSAPMTASMSGRSSGMQPQMMPPQMMQASMTQPGHSAPGAGAPMQAPSPMGVAPASFTNPHLPGHAWPAYAQYPNSAAVSYPTQYSASAWPYIGPFYPYPQVPMGWREVSLEWDDGYWQLNFNKEKDKWYWILNPKSW